jgi:hypothetical protein
VAVDQAGAALLQSSYRIYQYLDAENKSFDRYTSAYQAGDSRSALLQYEAILYYLGLYKREATNNRGLLDKFKQEITIAGFQDGTDDPAALATFEQELTTNGLPNDLIAVLTGAGFSYADVGSINKALTVVQPDELVGSPFAALTGIGAALRVSDPGGTEVPEPDGRLLFCTALLALLSVRARRRCVGSACGQDRSLARKSTSACDSLRRYWHRYCPSCR